MTRLQRLSDDELQLEIKKSNIFVNESLYFDESIQNAAKENLQFFMSELLRRKKIYINLQDHAESPLL